MSFDRVLITGGSGKLGGYTIDAAPDGQSITVVDIAPSASRDVHFIQASVTDLEALSTAFAGHDAVVHLGAIPNQFEAGPETVMSVNVQGTWNVFQAAELAGVQRVVLCSSDSAVGLTVNPEQMDAPLYLPVDEAHPRRPTEAYGLSKLLGEVTGRSFSQRGQLEVVVLRPMFVLFRYLHDETIARARDPSNYTWPAAGAPRPAGGGPWCHYVDPEDVGRAVWLALGLEGIEYDVFFLGAPTTYAPEPTLDVVQRFFGKLPEVRKPDVYESNPHAPLFDTSHAREVLGFEGEGNGRRLIDVALETR